MQEAEVSLRLAIYHITNKLTNDNIEVCIDGAQIKTKDKVHFDIYEFLAANGIVKVQGEAGKWQGLYRIAGYEPLIHISSRPGIGDVKIKLLSGKKIYAECKKGKKNKSGQEYPLMREAIGQLMTGCELTYDMIPVVAVPYSEKSVTLARKWSVYTQIKDLGIKFYLVKEDGNIEIL